MRKKSGFTIVEQAIEKVPAFKNVVLKLDRQVELRGKRKSTLNNCSPWICYRCTCLPALQIWPNANHEAVDPHTFAGRALTLDLLKGFAIVGSSVHPKTSFS